MSRRLQKTTAHYYIRGNIKRKAAEGPVKKVATFCSDLSAGSQVAPSCRKYFLYARGVMPSFFRKAWMK